MEKGEFISRRGILDSVSCRGNGRWGQGQCADTVQMFLKVYSRNQGAFSSLAEYLLVGVNYGGIRLYYMGQGNGFYYAISSVFVSFGR